MSSDNKAENPAPDAKIPEPKDLEVEGLALHVGNLAPDVLESDLFEVFNTAAPVVNIAVVKDSITKVSLGYAYANFSKHEDAEKALNELNFKFVHGRPMRVKWSHRDKSSRGNAGFPIFISNLAEGVTAENLMDAFKPFGNVQLVHVVKNNEGNPTRLAFVQFERLDDAKAATSALHDTEVLGSTISMVPFHRARVDENFNVVEAVSRSTSSEPHHPPHLTVHVSNLPKSFTHENASALLAPFGTITNLALAMESTREGEEQCRGFCSVTFDSRDAAVAAVSDLDGKQLEGCEEKLSAQLQDDGSTSSSGHGQKFKDCNLYVRNIAWQVTDEELHEAFSQHGKVVSARVMRDERGNGLGYGFVCFSTPLYAARAIQMMHSARLRGKPLYVAIAQSKEERRKMNEARLAQGGFRPQMAPMQVAGPVSGQVMQGQPMQGQPMPGQPIPMMQMPANGMAPSAVSRQQMGNALFLKITSLQLMDLSKARMVTGMLLNYDDWTLQRCLQNDQELKTKVHETLAFLQNMTSQPQQYGQQQYRQPRRRSSGHQMPRQHSGGPPTN